ncbi:C40 family peptidase, partial [Streptomyces sp. SID7909]|uniref:C40 family peptidase n=3 Tax=unclassified Streptomyces TaxID=2593676 RepID=UPI0013BA86ED
YVWGANGPSGFDCSGLMQWAWAQAGVSLPRTSQAQRYAGHMVPLSEARPGDLVAYRADASHIAMYVGNGQVIHAPYPGAPVRYDPVGMMPVSSVTRV